MPSSNPAVFYIGTNNAGDYFEVLNYTVPVLVYGNGGHDTLVALNNGLIIADLGQGSAYVYAEGNQAVDLNMGRGDNVAILNHNSYGYVQAGGGDNYVAGDGNYVVNLHLGDGNNTVDLNGNAWADVNVGSGNNNLYTSGNHSVSAGGGGGSGSNSLHSYGDSSIRVDIHGDGDNHVDAFDFGNGSFNFGEGNDTLRVGGENGFSQAHMGGGDDLFVATGHLTTITDLGNGNDVGQGGDGTDIMYGGDGNDILSGRGGNDYLIGGNGNDALFGGDGKNYLDGGNGNDLLVFKPGDYSVGGSGADTFVFNGEFGKTGSATIADFNPWAGDKLDLGHEGLTPHDMYNMPDGTLVAHNDYLGVDMAFLGVTVAPDSPAIQYHDDIMGMKG